MGAYEDMMSGTEELSSEPSKGLLGNAWSDVTSTLSNYGTGAVQGFKEVVRSGNQLAESNPLALTGTPMQEGMTNAPAPPQTEQQQQDLAQYGTATGNFGNETIKPVLGAAAFVNPIAAATYTPFLASDIKKSYQEGGAGQVARELTYGPVVDFASQPDLYQQFMNRPVSTTASGAMSVLPLALMGRGLHESLTKIPKVTENGDLLREPNPTIAEDFNNFRTAQEEVKPIPAPVAPIEPPPVEVQASAKGSDIISSGEQQLGTPYQLGADGINATDCGKFTQDTLAKNGINLDYRTADGQYLQLQNEGKTFTSESEAQVGDLVFFDVPSNRKTWSPSDDPASVNSSGEAYKGITHVGIYAGEGKVLQAGSHGVSYADINAFGDIVGFGKTAGEGKGKSTVTTAPIRNEKSSAEATRQIAEDQASADVVSKDLSDIVNKSEETWKMSKEKYDQMIDESPIVSTAEKASFPHEKIIEQAIKEEKPVPMEVLKDYPELVSKYPAEIARIESKLKEGEQASLGGYSTIPAETTYSKPVTRSEIIKDVNELIPARAGRIGSFEGLYKGDPGVIRSKNYGDVETLSHEIGHFVDSKLNIVGHDAELINAADTQWTGNKSYDKYTPEQRRAEGIAEFGRQYMINQAESLKNFPEYGKDFVAKLATDKKLSKQIDLISNKMRAWHAQSPGARARGGMSFAGDNKKSILEQSKYLGLKAYEQWSDDKNGLVRFMDKFEEATGVKVKMEDNPERLARLAENSASAKSGMLISEKDAPATIKALNVYFNDALIHEVTINSILDRVRNEVTNKDYPDYLYKNNFKSWDQAFSTYLTAERQLEIQSREPNYLGSMSKEDAKSFLSDAPKGFSDIAQEFYNFGDNLLRIRLNDGLISLEQYNAIKESGKKYASMSRDFSDTSTKINGNSAGKGFGNIADKLKSLTEQGSGRNVLNPVETMIKDTYTTLNVVERNRVAKAFVKLADIEGSGRFIEKVDGIADSKNSIFTILVDGKKQAYQTEPEYYRAIMSLEEKSLPTWTKFFTIPAKWARMGATTTLNFIGKNTARDTIEAGLYSRNGFIPVVDTVKGIFAMFKNEDLYNEYLSSGADMGSRMNMNRDMLDRQISDTLKGKDFSNPINSIKTLAKTAKEEPLKLAYEVPKTIITALEWGAKISETGTRLGEYSKARGLGKPIQEAALDGQSVTLNFTRGGSIGKQVNQFIPFFNASIQGVDKFARAIATDNTVRAKTSGLVLATALIAIMNADNRQIQELPQWEKDTNWFFPIGDQILKIPKPQEINIFFNAAEEAVNYIKNNSTRTGGEFLTESLKGFIPNMIPSVALTIGEWITGYSAFRQKDIVPQAMQNMKPENQFNTKTSETAKGIGKLTGTSPMKLDNAFNDIGAGLAGYLVLSTDALLNGIAGKDKVQATKDISDYPLASAFLSKNENTLSQSTKNFYDKLKELEQDHMENGKKGVVKPELQKYRRANTALQEVYKQNKIILGDNNITSDTKKAKIDTLQQKHNQIILKALGK
jgi:cell wall-associated NlpC family hydrolase